MNISGIGVIQEQLQKEQKTSQTLDKVLLNNPELQETDFEKESFHMEIELKDGTKVSIDYLYEGVSKKAQYELGRYADYTYGNDLYTPENTATRILDFAKSLWDGSSEQLDTITKAIEQGVKEARKILGTMPDWLDSLIGKTEELLQKGIEEMKGENKETA
mgnify:CR=1 FL=1